MKQSLLQHRAGYSAVDHAFSAAVNYQRGLSQVAINVRSQREKEMQRLSSHIAKMKEFCLDHKPTDC